MPTVSRFLILSLISISTLASPPAAYAQPQQTNEAGPDRSWKTTIDEQLHALLTNRNQEIQERGMQLIIELQQKHTLSGHYTPLVDRLFSIYDRDRSVGRRLLALSALDALRQPEIVRRLTVRLPYEESERVRRHTKRVISARAIETTAARRQM